MTNELVRLEQNTVFMGFAELIGSAVRLRDNKDAIEIIERELNRRCTYSADTSGDEAMNNFLWVKSKVLNS